ncbi:MAG: leucine-rich repeat domain-containing protein [Clostridiales bacterium]|nr:leucine-rich repeat domain-containing protein [Clostridiales bacterium]
MKKIISCILVLFLLCALACVGNNGKNDIVVEEPKTPATATPSATVRPTGTPAPLTPEPTIYIPEDLVLSGQCGKNLTWTVDPYTSTLTISGKGAMWDYSAWGKGFFPIWDYERSAPWIELGDWFSAPEGGGERLFDRIVVEEGITTIGNSAFRYMELEQVSLPDSLKTIGERAFFNCRITSSFSIPENVTSIGKWAFAQIFVSEYIVDAKNKSYCTVDGVLFSKNMQQLISYPSGKKVAEYTVPKSVKSLGDWAFCYSQFNLLILPHGLAQTGWCSLHGLILSELRIPSTVRNINKLSFEDVAIGTLIIPEGVKTITEEMFLSTIIERVILPASLRTIEYAALEWFSEVYFLGRPPIVKMNDDELGYDNENTILYYPREYEHLWDPDWADEWYGYRIEAYDTLP